MTPSLPAALQSTQTWQDAILDSADFTIISTDSDGIIQTFNAGALRKLGYTAEEVIGKVTPAIIHDPHEVAQQAQQLTQELGYPIEPGFEVFVAKARLGIADENIWTYIRKDGSRFPVHLSVTAMRDQVGQLTGFLGIGKDMTEQQQAKRSLKESEARFEGAIRYAAIGMALVAPEGHWLKVNASLCNLVGYSEQELLALTFQDITHSEDLETDLGYVQQMLTGEIESYDMEKRYIHKQGHVVWILLSVSLVRGESGEPLYFVAQIQDISHRKQAEADLHQLNDELEQRIQERVAELEKAYQCLKLSEAKYQDLYEKAPDMYVSTDAATHRIVKCNLTLLETLGYCPEDILGESIFKLYHPDCHAAVTQALKIFREKDEVLNTELQVQRSDGSTIDVSLSIQAIYNQDGKIVQSRSSWRNITHRKHLEQRLKDINTQLEERVTQRTVELLETNQALEGEIRVREQAEQALTKSEERLQLALEGSGDGLWDWDIAQDKIYFGPRFQTMLGYEVGELDGGVTVWEAMIHPEDSPWVREKLAAHLHSNDSLYAFDYRVRMKSGAWKWIANFGKVVSRDQQGQPLRMTGTHRDISDSKHSELALRRKEAFLSSIYDGTKEGIFVVDVQGDTFQFAGLNATYEELTGLSSVDVKGAALDKILCTEVATRMKQYYQACVALGDTLSYEETLFKNNQEVYCLTSLTPLFDADSQVYRLIGTSIDITDRKQAQQQLQQAHDNLARSNQELEQFAYVASHDLQEPLRKIQVFSELAMTLNQGQFDEKTDLYLGYVVDGAVRMQTLIRDLLAYSKVGRAEVSKEATDLSQVMRHVTTDLETVITENQASIDIGPLPTVHVNPTLMRQLLQNLVGNALKYRTEIPPVVEVRAEATGENWTFSVRDNGIGIAPKYKERIFVIFQRLHSRQEYSGTGIGLAICKKIVEFHGGHIWLESEVGEGCTFNFTLPREVPPQETSPRATAANALPS